MLERVLDWMSRKSIQDRIDSVVSESNDKHNDDHLQDKFMFAFLSLKYDEFVRWCVLHELAPDESHFVEYFVTEGY